MIDQNIVCNIALIETMIIPVLLLDNIFLRRQARAARLRAAREAEAAASRREAANAEKSEMFEEFFKGMEAQRGWRQ